MWLAQTSTATPPVTLGKVNIRHIVIKSIFAYSLFTHNVQEKYVKIMSHICTMPFCAYFSGVSIIIVENSVEIVYNWLYTPIHPVGGKELVNG